MLTFMFLRVCWRGRRSTLRWVLFINNLFVVEMVAMWSRDFLFADLLPHHHPLRHVGTRHRDWCCLHSGCSGGKHWCSTDGLSGVVSRPIRTLLDWLLAMIPQVLGMVLSSIIIHQMRYPERPTILTVPTIFTAPLPKYQELQNPPQYY